MEVRVGDAERQAVVERLSAALAEGRLQLDEFDHRSGEAYKARTQAELVALTVDLPGGGKVVAPAPRRRGLARLSGSERNWLRVSILLTGIWLVSSIAGASIHPFWPIFPIGIWGVVLLSQRVTGGHDRDRPRSED
jgi:hypothetical protein